MKSPAMKQLALCLALLVGVPTPALAQALVTIVNDVSVALTGLRPNRNTGTVDTLATLTNTGTRTIAGPLQLGVPTLAPAGVALTGQSGALPDGTPFVTVTLPAGGLEPGQGVADVPLHFSSGPTSFTTAVYELAPGAPLAVPAFTSNPGTSANVGVQYAYDAVATSPNGGTLAFSLPQAPAGMTIDPASGAIRWTPGAATTANVTVHVSDGKSATPGVQSFSIEAKEVVIPGLQVGSATPPDLVCPPNQATAGSASGAIVNYPAPTYNPLRSVACSPASGSSFLPGDTTVTCATQDAAEPPGACSFAVSVSQPVVQPAPIIISLGGGNRDADVGVGYACYDGYGDLASTVDGSAAPLAAGVLVVTPSGETAVQRIETGPGGTLSLVLSPPPAGTTCSPTVQERGTGTLVVTNFGHGTANNVRLDIVIPYGVDRVGIQTSKGLCDDAIGVVSRLGKVVRCSFGDLAKGERVFLPVGFDFDSEKILPSSPISVSSDSPDPNQQNNALVFSPPISTAPSFVKVKACYYGTKSNGECKPAPTKCKNKFNGTFAALLDTCGAPQVVVQVVSAVITGVAAIATGGALAALQAGTLTMSGSRIFISAAAAAGSW